MINVANIQRYSSFKKELSPIDYFSRMARDSGVDTVLRIIESNFKPDNARIIGDVVYAHFIKSSDIWQYDWPELEGWNDGDRVVNINSSKPGVIEKIDYEFDEANYDQLGDAAEDTAIEDGYTPIFYADVIYDDGTKAEELFDNLEHDIT